MRVSVASFERLSRPAPWSPTAARDAALPLRPARPQAPPALEDDPLRRLERDLAERVEALSDVQQARAAVGAATPRLETLLRYLEIAPELREAAEIEALQEDVSRLVAAFARDLEAARRGGRALLDGARLGGPEHGLRIDLRPGVLALRELDVRDAEAPRRVERVRERLRAADTALDGLSERLEASVRRARVRLDEARERDGVERSPPVAAGALAARIAGTPSAADLHRLAPARVLQRLL